MHFEQSQLYDLIDAVEDAGGEYLDELCSSRTMKMTGDQGTKEITVAGCGNLSIFVIPYDVPAEGTNATVLGSMKVCGLCDDVGWWPRFVDQVMHKRVRSAKDV